ncbi:SigB/SigF/SigG family RNA polymerase sigma factor [Nocardia camponoti]|uniref:RNA polymerase sigma factor SigF n=1 Tax=Nocardia camponoti TaxID=1616106 RepID=A0A917Q709_9NOCA|nr:SigB/SigF/SigG family RNA polymerase sigma factor [Nocardia camponoti]GGK32769.1 RNA polymerase sigma factor SigF [Nocardia camponoti]
MNEDSTSPSHGDSYDHIEDLFTELDAAPAGEEHDTLRAEVIERCLPLADHIARKFAGRGEQFDDLEQTARVGLVLAVDRFDTERGHTFLSFAIPTIMGEVRRHFRDRTWAVHVPRRLKELQQRINPAVEELCQRLGHMPSARELATELDVDVLEVSRAMVASNGYQTNPIDGADDGFSKAVSATLGADESCYELTENAITVRPLLADLPPRERQVLTMRFFGELTQSEIAARLGVSQMQVSRMLSRTLASLRARALDEPALAA